MRYHNITQGIFLERPNRFIALVEIDGQVVRCHVKNTGRCRELLPAGARVWLEKSDRPGRKTAYDLVAVYKEGQGNDQIINMDSQAPNIAVGEWLRRGNLFPDMTLLQPECRFGQSRLDFYAEMEEGKRKVFLEVKGVTLEENGIARFPDAPTGRGTRHLKELERAVSEGYEAAVLFVIQMRHIQYMEPNGATDPEFAESLRSAAEHGVQVLAYDCVVTEDSMEIHRPVPVHL